MRNLRIGFVLDDGLDNPDGVQQNILTFGSWLRNQGHDVNYLVGKTTRTDIPGVISLSKNLPVSFNENRLSMPIISSAKKINQVLSQEKFDVIHVQVPYSPLMAARLIKRLDKRVALIGTFHILPSGWASSYGTKLLGRALKYNLKNFDRQLAVSVPAKIFAKQSFDIDCHVLPNPVDTKRFVPINALKKESGNIRLLFLGRLVERKGCEHLLQAVQRMASQYPPKTAWQLDICGDGAMKQKLKKLAGASGLEKNLSFHGFVSEAEKIQFMRRADVSILPSTGGESFGIVLIEAMASRGGIVLGGNNPGYASVLGSLPESLIDPFDYEAFAKTLSKYIDSKRSRAALYKKQQALVGEFDIEVVGPKLLEIYKACIRTKKSR